MGYCTHYSLETNDDLIVEHKENLDVISDYGSDTFQDDIKWYEHEHDLKEYSKQYPKVLFILHGLSEEGEQWKKYFKNGKVQYAPAKITYDEFDENLLR